jgi:hypothetical protein
MGGLGGLGQSGNVQDQRHASILGHGAAQNSRDPAKGRTEVLEHGLFLAEHLVHHDA